MDGSIRLLMSLKIHSNQFDSSKYDEKQPGENLADEKIEHKGLVDISHEILNSLTLTEPTFSFCPCPIMNGFLSWDVDYNGSVVASPPVLTEARWIAPEFATYLTTVASKGLS